MSKQTTSKPFPDLTPGILYCDRRVGSREFAKPLNEIWGIKTNDQLELPSGDFAFMTGADFMGGRGPMRIGIERKTLSDMCGSLLRNRLGGHQVPRMLVDFPVCWVLLEGVFRCALRSDTIEVHDGRGWRASRHALSYTALNSWLVRYDIMGGGQIRRWRTSSPSETCAFIASVFRWCTKSWKKHQAITIEKMAAPEKVLLYTPSNLARTAASLPFIGSKGARKAERYFSSIGEMIGDADVEDWIAAGIGKANSIKLMKAIWKQYRPSKVKARRKAEAS